MPHLALQLEARELADDTDSAGHVQRPSPTKASFVCAAFIVDLLVVVALVEADGETAASVSAGAAVKAEAGWRGSSATEFTRGGCGSEVAVASSAGFRLDSAGPFACSASGRERMQISVESMINAFERARTKKFASAIRLQHVEGSFEGR